MDEGGFDHQPVRTEVVKEVNKSIRSARSLWDAHKNGPCRAQREKALRLYETLTPEEKDLVPQELKVWLKYRSEKYFGDHRTPPGGGKTS